MSFSTFFPPDVLEDVARAHSLDEHLQTVCEVFDGSGKRDPSKVFRSHYEEEGDVVVEPDVSYRLAADLLLGSLSALHMAAFEYSSRPFPERQTIRKLLKEDALRDYYEKHYPYAPPILIRAVMRRELPTSYFHAWIDELRHDEFLGAYRRFLHLNARFVADESLGEFLFLLDDFYVGKDHLANLRAALNDPDKLHRWLSKRSRWQLVEGMETFFEFALELDELLRSTDLPILRGHIWLHFAYWFGSGGKRMFKVAEMLAVAAKRVEGPESDETAAGLIEALRRLLDPNGYPAEVIALTQDALEPWLQYSEAGKRWVGPSIPEPDAAERG